jgi:arsenite methyltransferase
MPAPAMPRTDYGLDAPGVVRNLLVAAAAGLALWTITLLRVWSGRIVIGPLIFPLGNIGLLTGAVCLAMAVWMVWESKIGKIKGRERLLDMLPWSGSESVLDIGCGRGLMLIGAAKRLHSGKATGIDLWQAEDLSANRPEATLENAKREGVTDRVEVRTADMRTLPFPDGSFDIVLSSNAIHNLYASPDRAKAVTEIARVLKPGGRVLINDIRHVREYARVCREHGCPETHVKSSWLIAALLAVITMGSLRPAILLARKAS